MCVTRETEEWERLNTLVEIIYFQRSKLERCGTSTVRLFAIAPFLY